jgi:hypothetical protein
MKPNTTRWIYSTLGALAVAGAASIGQAASPVIFDFAGDLQGWAGNEPTGMAATYTWNATGGSTGGGCMQVVFDGTTTTEMDPVVTLPTPINGIQYASVSVRMKIDSGSGVAGTGGSGGYGNFQAILRDSGWSWDSMWYGTIYSPAGNDWVTYTFNIVPPYKTDSYLQLQLGGSGYSGPVTVYIDRVVINPLPNPLVVEAFTSGYDSSSDCPFANPVTGAAGTNITPAGSWSISITDPGSWSGWNQLGLSRTDLTRFEKIGFDVYLDSASGSAYGGFQLLQFKGDWSGSAWAGSVSFNASMVGKWTHFDFPSSSGITNCPALVIQGIPGSDGGAATTVNFHVDNIVLWKAATRPSITRLSPGTPAGITMTVDENGTLNQYDQEGISCPSADSSQNFFWINQAPATFSFTLTNFPAPASAPGFHAHVYLVNGDSLGSGYSWNQTYSGAPFNALDYAGLWIENGTNGNGVVATFEWKTNSPGANPTNRTIINLTEYTTANGTWALNFSDNTHATIVGPKGTSVGDITLPDFLSDPNYSANFTPATSMVQFGVAKNDVDNTGVNNGKSATFTHVLVTNAVAGILYDDPFEGPGLTGKYAWRVTEYWQFAANRISWSPANTAYWLKWNTTASGWSILSSGDLSTWADAGVTYTYTDATGTNTVGAIPAGGLPAGNAGFFRLANPNP